MSTMASGHVWEMSEAMVMVPPWGRGERQPSRCARTFESGQLVEQYSGDTEQRDRRREATARLGGSVTERHSEVRGHLAEVVVQILDRILRVQCQQVAPAVSLCQFQRYLCGTSSYGDEPHGSGRGCADWIVDGRQGTEDLLA